MRHDTASVILVRACLRGNAGGSPTAVVLEDAPLTDDQRREVPAAQGTSHAVFVRLPGDGPIDLRFFTSAGELPACGHGTIAALAALAGGRRRFETTLRTGDRVFEGWCEPNGRSSEAAFDPGPVKHREPDAAERSLVSAALGFEPELRVAGIGRERVLASVPDRATLAALTPDMDRLRDACDRSGLLGVYVYSRPSVEGSLAARMFAPSIGVPEDIANANSTACLAAYLGTAISVDMGDSLGSPATITATGRGGEVRAGGRSLIEAEFPLHAFPFHGKESGKP
ncbi:PhzF family phenazine biosynthesis protein [Amycolatopsis sp. NPDC089917]|uniref:PhzF family phenazine biosynthesis protein n=1 Tax=Amycolatopsis sp. NPDC089917 TaxID=3155187 RepID=UPI003440D492